MSIYVLKLIYGGGFFAGWCQHEYIVYISCEEYAWWADG